jgi:hypothetical protein|tara:strand:+ start:3106 stop:3453 length:348 start_codon:yes stop_codon:yes gene_type:complete
MGSTLEAQKAKSPTPKKRIKVSPGKPYYSSPEVEAGWVQSLPSEVEAARTKHRVGKRYPSSFRGYTNLRNLFRGEEGKVGARLAREAAEEAVYKDRADLLLRYDGGFASKKTRVF